MKKINKTAQIQSTQDKRLIDVLEQVVTKVVKKEVQEIIDKKLSNYPTKVEMDEKFTKFEMKMDDKLEKLERKIDDNSRGYRDDVLNKMDETMSELEQIRETNIFHEHDIHELKQTIKKHEKEISTLKHI